MKFLKLLPLFLLANTLLMAQNQRIDITQFGAVGDGKWLNTTAIQAAIDTCATQGGGRVVVPPGRFLTGSIWLKSGVTLELQAGATLLGDTHRMNYQKNNWYALVLAHSARHIGIVGAGTIDGQGTALAANTDSLYHAGLIKGGYRDNRTHESERPQLIDFEQCAHVHVQGITLRNSACWVQRYGCCDSLTIEDIKVESMAFWNNDGIDLVDCTHTLVQNCDINAADDGICFKSDRGGMSDQVVVRNCRVRSSASALKFGTNSFSGFKNIKVEGLEVYDTFRSAIAIECVDGGILENIEVSNVRARNTGNAIFIRLGQRHTKQAGILRNVYIHDVHVQVPNARPDVGYTHPGPEVKVPHNLMPSSIVGLPGHRVSNVRLEDITIEFGGGGNCQRACVLPDSLHLIPELPADYPEFSMFGELPAWGFFCRHVQGLEMKNVRLVLEKGDYRPPLVFDDVEGLVISDTKWRKKGGLRRWRRI